MDYLPCWRLEFLPTKKQKKFIGKNSNVANYYSQLTLDILKTNQSNQSNQSY